MPLRASAAELSCRERKILNSILLEVAECSPEPGLAAWNWELPIEDRRARHMLHVLKLPMGREFHMGLIDHSIGTGRWISHESDVIRGIYNPSQIANEIPLAQRSLILGLPRPKSLRRILRMIGNLGIQEVHLINTARVDKSYWSSPWLEEHAQRAALLEGLEIACRGGATLPRLPRIQQHRLFRPFAEDHLPRLVSGYQGLVLHPGVRPSEEERATRRDQPLMFAIGPEGGFVDFELELFQRAGFQKWSFGERCWSVEVAVPFSMAYFSPA